MRIYLAARYSRHPELQIYAALLTAHGHEITCRWILGDHELRSDGQAETDVWAPVWAAEDLEDLQAADVVISFTEEPGEMPGRNRGGRHAEFLAAYVLGKRSILIGPREHVFHWLPRVERYRTLEQVLAALHDVRERR